MTTFKTDESLVTSSSFIAELQLPGPRGPPSGARHGKLIEVTCVCEVCRMTKSLFYDCQVNLFKTGQNWLEAKLRI